MAMRFPKVRDVPLQNSPLVDVLCQVRFPAILKIAQSQPAEFQERVRDRFPVLEVEQGIRIGIPSLGSEARLGVETSEPVYRFRSPFDPTVVTLARDFYAVSTDSYKSWPDFAEVLATITQAVSDVYRPAYAERIGLRYVNNLTLHNTGSSSAKELIDFPRSEITALLKSSEWDVPESLLTEMVLSDEFGKLKFRSGFTGVGSKSTLLLDFDFFEEGNLLMETVIERTTRYHDIIYAAFRWCIPDESLGAFGPSL